MEQDWIDISAGLDCGVYALLYNGRVVYVGQSKFMLRRLWEHSMNKGKLRKHAPGFGRIRFRFDEIWVRPCSIDELDALEATMIARYTPRYNLQPRVGSEMPDSVRAMLTPSAPVLAFNRRGL